MSEQHGSVCDREARLDAVLGAYLEALAAGRAPAREDLLTRHPDLAAELSAFFADQEAVDRWTEPLRPAAQAALTEAVAAVLTPPPDGSPCPTPETPLPFGSGYELLEEIGRGGMGVVYKARQKVPSRLVALKVIRAGWLASPAEVQRFRAEAEAAASLDHPNIVPVYEVGEHAGQPFFSTKLVEGGSLAQWISDFRLQIADLTRDVQADMARLLAQVARAVHHAHQRGILHRDLKPANVLLRFADLKSAISNLKSAIPLVADFGLAKRLGGDGSLTESGALVGTPSYMAPEQAGGSKQAVTTATDVYGLGAIFYALLTGRPPFRADTTVGTLLLVRERAPEPPRRINARLDRDLDTVCLKCLEKDPQRRYGSAEAVAEDLERWLAGEPIAARPVSRRARFWHWCKRNPVVAVLTGTLIGVMGLATIVLAISTVRLWRAQAETEQQRDAARRERDQAEARYRYAREVVDDFYTRAAETWLGDEPHAQKQGLAFLEKALQFYQQFVRDHPDDLAARHRLALAFGRVGSAERHLGHYPEAEKLLRQAIDLLEKLLADDPSRAAVRSDLALGYHKMGITLRVMGRAGQAELYFRKDLEQQQHLVKKFPGKSEHRSGLRRAFLSVGDILYDNERLGEAEKAYRHAADVQPCHEADAEADRDFHRGHASALRKLGMVLRDSGRQQEADRYLRQALAEIEPLANARDASPGDRQDLGFCYNHLGCLLLFWASRPGEAKGLLRRAVAVRKKLASDFPDIRLHQEELSASYDNLGVALRRTRELSEAEEALGQGVALSRTQVQQCPAVPDYRSELGAHLNDLALLRLDQRNLIEARRLLNEAIENQETALKANGYSPIYRDRLRTHYNNLGQVSLRLRDHTAAARAAARLTAISPGAWSNADLALRLLVQCEPLALKDQALPEEKRQALNRAYGKQVRELLRRMVEHHPADANAENTLAWTLVTLPDRALQDASQAVQLAQRAVERAPRTKAYWNTLGVARYRACDWTGAAAALERSCQLGQGGDGSDWFFLAMTRWQLGDKEQARHWYSRAVAWMKKNAPEDEELSRFRAEAASLLGIPEHSPNGKEAASSKK